jgi:polysaccharide export outer membrane protein
MLTIQDALSFAGAPFDAPYTAQVAIRETGGVRRASLAQILAGPSLPLAGDTDIIVTIEPAAFNAMGAVRRQGPVPLVKAHTSLLEALSATGGLDGMRANARGVFVFRASSLSDADSRPIIYQLDMRRPDAFIIAQRFTMLPDDTLYVTEAPVAQWAKVLSAIQGTVNIGASAATIERLAK